MKSWYRYMLYTIIAVAVILALWTGWQRHYRESINKDLAVVVDYDQVVKLAARENLTEREVLSRLRNLDGQGITGVLFKEQTLTSQGVKDLWVKTGAELLANPTFSAHWRKIKPDYTYILTRDKREFERIRVNLEAKVLGVEVSTQPEAGIYLVGTPLTQGQLKEIGLGFPVKGLDLVANMGLKAMVQVRSWPYATPEGITQFFSLLRPYENINVVLFNDEKLLPFTEVVAGEIRLLGAKLASIEFFPQQGFSRLAAALDKRVVRLHAIGTREMAHMTVSKAVDRFVLAATDRNNRILFVRFFFNPDSSSWLKDNQQYLSMLISELKAKGFNLGEPETFPPFKTSRVMLFIIGLGCIAGGMLLLDITGYRRWGVAAGVFFAVLWAAMLASGYISLGRKLFALGGTIVFPTLAVAGFVREKPRHILASLGVLMLTVLVSMIGAVLMVGLLAEKSFMLRLDQFMGVKAAFLGPPFLIFVIYAFLKYPPEKWLLRVRAVLNRNITVKYAWLVGILGLIGIIYVMRSGNEGIFVSSLELEVRRFLNDLLVVRPRTKEFLIGHPLLMLVFYLGYRDYLLPVLMLATIGQVSLVNTFAHTWTPLAVSVLRTFNGLWLGVFGGIVLILLVKAWYWWEAKYLRD